MLCASTIIPEFVWNSALCCVMHYNGHLVQRSVLQVGGIADIIELKIAFVCYTILQTILAVLSSNRPPLELQAIVVCFCLPRE